MASASLLLRSVVRSTQQLRVIWEARHCCCKGYSTTARGASEHHQDSSLQTLPGSTIQVSQEEQKLFDYLLDVVKTRDLRSELRVAGGWVRDKLLAAKGRPVKSQMDLDIVLDDMTGQDFANHLLLYNQQNHLPEQKIGVVKINPAKSKHLETAATSIHGNLVDFVNMRTEAYDGSSRIPTAMALGDPRQDSRRRDFTINALFFNIQRNRIEDYNNGQGLADLEAGILRTPDEPQTTLLDDPLRVLRGLRFKATFSFQFASDLCKAMENAQVKEALLKKVSRERIGIELKKIFQLESERVKDALDQIATLGLHDPIFPRPPYNFSSGILEPQARWSEQQVRLASLCLEQFAGLEKEAADKDIAPSLTPPLANGLALASSFLLPMMLAHSKQPSDGVDGLESIDASLTHCNVEDLFKQGLRLPKGNASFVSEILHAMIFFLELGGKSSHRLDHLVHLVQEKRVELAYWLREIRENQIKSNRLPSFDLAWQSAVRLAFIFRENWARPSLPTKPHNEKHDATLFVKAVKEAGLMSLSEAQPLLSGKEIMEILDVKPGPHVEQLKKQLIMWQLANWGQTTKEKAIAYVANTLSAK